MYYLNITINRTPSKDVFAKNKKNVENVLPFPLAGFVICIVLSTRAT